MGVTSDYETKTYKYLLIRFVAQLALFIIGVLIASAIFLGIEKSYDNDDFHYPDYHDYHNREDHHNSTDYHKVLLDDEIAFVKNHSSMKSFAKENKIPIDKIIKLVHNVTATLDLHYDIQELHVDTGLAMDEHDNEHEINDFHSKELFQLTSDEDSQAISVEEDYWNIHDHGMTFLHAFVLTLSIVSTIGWGHVTPITVGGKAFAVIVALFGIPLTLIMVISGCHLVMRSLKAVVRNTLRWPRTLNDDRVNDYVQLAYKPILIALFLGYIFVTAAIIGKLEDYDYGDALWYVMMGLTTVGFGDVVQDGVFYHDKQAKRVGLAVFIMFWIVFGFISIGSIVLSFLYDFSVSDQHQSQFYKKNNQDELVDDTDDYEPNTYNGGSNIYTGEMA